MKNQYKHYFILFSLALIWGSSFILMEKGLHTYKDINTYSYMQVASLRIFIAFISLLPFLYLGLKDFKSEKIIPLIFVGLLGNGIPAFLFTFAQESLESSFVGRLNSLTPIFTLILGLFYFNIKTTYINIIGIIIGFLGALVLSFPKLKYIYEFNIPMLAVFLATIFYGISINIIKRYLGDVDATSIAAVSFLFIGPFSGYYIFSTDFLEIIKTDGSQSSIKNL